MNLKFFLLIASLLLVCIASSCSAVIPVFRNRKLSNVLQVNEGEDGEIHTRKEKQISVNFSRSPPAKGWICCDD
ncbi:PREDICTED: uncharacterized protein LOC106303896 [Brassica oleracea var. oleracea]|uniref:uncharacterized protein LOC106303896 n=1 Tax=Brassica oleracea var. oleracea TaxID=109376 RepID=UPI0006A6BFA9|nr:PREDICTED: uncharacterized protein LOC106303896 [Brassica oleracea var. oleracea]